jgi:5-formyltetrahydrofolate cyclo-ligase
MTKSELRKHIATLRPDFQTLEPLSAAVLKKFQTLEPDSTRAHSSFQGLERIQQAKAIGAYVPLPDEVDVSPLFQGLENNGYGAHHIFIPAFDETLGSYRMAKYTPELKQGKFGIPEPVEPVWAEADELDLILVPGVAFDRAGTRLGRGGGFYDRLLPLYNATHVGICFDFQLVEKIPTEPHDCRMDLLVTETKILKFAMNS